MTKEIQFYVPTYQTLKKRCVCVCVCVCVLVTLSWYHGLNRREFDKFWETVKNREAWHAAVHGIAKS